MFLNTLHFNFLKKFMNKNIELENYNFDDTKFKESLRSQVLISNEKSDILRFDKINIISFAKEKLEIFYR